MKRLKVCVLVFFIIFCNSFAEDIFAPFVSRIKIALNTSSVKLIWKDSNDIDGKYLIYTSSEEITEENFNKAVKIGEAEKGQEYFVYYPEDNREYFFIIMGTKANGEIYKLFVPFRNLTIEGVSIESPVIVESKYIETLIKNIRAVADKDSIIVSFQSSRLDKNLFIYRSIRPIKTSNDIIKANRIVSISSSDTNYIDYPVPGVEYYYAIVDSSQSADKILISPGENASINPVELPVGIGRIGLPEADNTYSKFPLPYLSVTSEIETGKALKAVSLPEKRDLSLETQQAIIEILGREDIKKDVHLSPVILNIDQTASVEGEEYTLRTILDNEFKDGRWIEAAKLLNNFLSLKHSKNIENRSHFYLGQVYYFSKEYKKAYLEFIFSTDFYSYSKLFQDDILKKFSSKS